MVHHRVNIHEGTAPEDALVSGAPQLRRTYVCVTTLIQNGTTYPPGSTVLLDPDTASRFIALGEVKETS